MNVELEPKRLELLHEVVPGATTIALLVNPNNPRWRDQSERTCRRRPAPRAAASCPAMPAPNATSKRPLQPWSNCGPARSSIGTDAFFNARSEQLGALATRHADARDLPYGEFVAAGGLMSYGTSVTDSYRLVGVYTGRILKGDKPADLPVQQSTKVELVINLKTAKALGLTVPTTLLGRADEVIE